MLYDSTRPSCNNSRWNNGQNRFQYCQPMGCRVFSQSMLIDILAYCDTFYYWHSKSLSNSYDILYMGISIEHWKGVENMRLVRTSIIHCVDPIYCPLYKPPMPTINLGLCTSIEATVHFRPSISTHFILK